jgi:N6-adenosine-specific RNA methylase IME4
MKFDIVVSDPCWTFNDRLEMSKIKRGAAANYALLDNLAIKELDIPAITEKNCILALWVPSSLLSTGLDTMKAWGFKQTQTWMWTKIKKDPFAQLKKILREKAYKNPGSKNKVIDIVEIEKAVSSFDFNSTLGFGMGRLFRQSHEIVLVGTKGKVYQNLKNKSQRSIALDFNTKHSAKPETLQDRLDLMFPNATNKLEMFARRSRPGWTCIGNECPSSLGEDIRDSITRLINLP